MITPEYVLAGRATFTVVNQEGHRYTYRVSQANNHYFVSMLSGPDNTRNYVYLGLLILNNGWVVLTKKSKLTEDTLPVKVIRWALGLVWRGQAIPAGYALLPSNRCARCGRLLTVPESILSGIGPECAVLMGRK